MEKMEKKETNNFKSIILSFVKYSLMNVFSVYINYLENDLKINDYPLLFNPVHKNLMALFWLCEPATYEQLTLSKLNENLIFDSYLQKEIKNENKYKQLKKDKYFLLNERLNFIYDLIVNEQLQNEILHELATVFLLKEKNENKHLKIFNKYYQQKMKKYTSIKRKIIVQPPNESKFYCYFDSTL